MLLNNPVFWHIIPLDGKFFDDTEQTVFSLVMLNLVVLGLFFIAMLAVRDQKRAARVRAKAAAQLAKDLSAITFKPDPEAGTDQPAPKVLIITQGETHRPPRNRPKNQSQRRKKD